MMRTKQDLIELSDLFRREVKFARQRDVERLVKTAREFVTECTWIDVTYPVETKFVQENITRLTVKLAELANAAQESGLNRIVLPLHADSPFAKFIDDNILSKYGFGLRIELRKSHYKNDLSAKGSIDPSIETILDEGLRGLSANESGTKYKWDAEIRNISPK